MVDIFPLQGGELKSPSGMIETRTQTNYQIQPARDGLDAIFFTQKMNLQLKDLEDNMATIMSDANLSDTQRQFDLQRLMNTWSTISQGQTNMLKAIMEVNKAIVRNIE
jgi:hypothetical protein